MEHLLLHPPALQYLLTSAVLARVSTLELRVMLSMGER